VGVLRVGGDTEHNSVKSLKLRERVVEREDLSRADKLKRDGKKKNEKVEGRYYTHSKVHRVPEEDNPFALVVRESDILELEVLDNSRGESRGGLLDDSGHGV
jgi:hypothetical protein